MTMPLLMPQSGYYNSLDFRAKPCRIFDIAYQKNKTAIDAGKWLAQLSA